MDVKRILLMGLCFALVLLGTGCPDAANPPPGTETDRQPDESPAPELYTVSFEVNGMGKRPADLVGLASGTALTGEQLPVLEFSGYSFGGWYKDAELTALWDPSADTVIGDTTLYAKWEAWEHIPETALWVSRSEPHPNDYYRIPALATLCDGTLFAVTDIRYTAPSDLGNGHALNLLTRRSTDNGNRWSEPTRLTHADISGKIGYGDAAVVADRESNRVLILCVSGDSTYQAGTATHHQTVKQYRSDDGGLSFTETDLTEVVYANNTNWFSLFFASGKMMQSRRIKVGSGYRIYAALLSKGYGNAVLYSDDFGKEWKLLGNAAASPVPNGDEPKVEELPDGRVLISSRKSGGRYFNFFTYTDEASGTGSWGTAVESALGSDGGTNGEICVIKARDRESRKPVSLVLQSIPSEHRRKKVTLYWRPIPQSETPISLAEFANAAEWESFLAEPGDSAYSTMLPMRDGGIGFLYEKKNGTTADQYDIVFKNLPISTITNGKYEAMVLGIGSKAAPYAGLTGEAVSQADRAAFANEATYWLE